jgi:hypothetical protein
MTRWISVPQAAADMVLVLAVKHQREQDYN